MSPEYDLCTSTWGEEEWRAGLHVLKGGHTTMGEHVRHFERQFAEYVGTRYAVMVNSGSSANLLMVAALVYTKQLNRYSRVAVPAICWSTTIAPLAQFGMVPVVVDVDDSLNIDPARVPEDVDAIFAINVLGNPVDFSALPPGPVLLEDNCEGLGAEYAPPQMLDASEPSWRRTGSFGVMASHSLFFSHHIHCMEGGVVTTDDEDLWRMLLMLRSHGWTRDLPDHKASFETSWEFRVPGYNVRPTDVQGAIAIKQMERLPEIVAMRQENGRVYQRAIGHQRLNGRSSWFAFPVRTEDRAKVIAELEGVKVRPILAGNIKRHDIMGCMQWEAHATPVADVVHEQGFLFGNHPHSVQDEILDIAQRLGQRHAA